MKSERTQGPGLKHLAYFETIASAPEGSIGARAATAGLLTLRLIDHWMLAGSVMVELDSVSVRSARHAIMAMADTDPSREVLIGLVNTMQTLREADTTPILPRLLAYASLLERQADFALAADVYGTVIGLADEQYDGDLLLDARLLLGFCERTLSQWEAAEHTLTEAGRVARRRGEPAKAMRAGVGVAAAVFGRGNVPRADEMLRGIVEECRHGGFREELGQALHASANVASIRSEHDRAVLLAYEALEITSDAVESERLLSDLGAFFARMGRFEAARDALLVLEGRATTEEVRTVARANLVAVGARSGDRALFQASIARVRADQLAPFARVNFLIESARGYRRFGEEVLGESRLEEARALAAEHRLNRAIIEIDEMTTRRPTPVTAVETPVLTAPDGAPVAHVEGALRKLAASLAG